MARADRDPDGKVRDRILERLRRIRELLRASRYRKDPVGRFRAAGAVPGGLPREEGPSPEIDDESPAPMPAQHRRQYGRSSDDYLADLVQEGGEQSETVAQTPQEPKVVWVSVEDGSRER